MTRKTYVVNGHLGSCFREKSTAFDFRMPIGRGHQLLVFGSHLKAEMFYVALVSDLWTAGQTTPSALS